MTRLRVIIPIVVGAVIALLPVPDGITSNAWYYFALFIAVILGLIFEPLPAAAIGFIGITLGVVLGLVADTPAESVQWGLSGFSNKTVWLIFGAFMLSLGYQKSGLGKRMALLLVKFLGKKTLGLGYAIAISDLLIAPFTPSNTARSAGTIFPIIQNIPPLFDSNPGPSARRMGSYLMWTAFATTGITSALFLTGLAPNLLALSFVREIAAVEISWTQWFVGFLPMGVLLFLFLPLLVYWIYPPQVKSSNQVANWATEELKNLGSVSRREITMAVLAGVALLLWIFGRGLIHATTVVWIVISLMILTKILDWDDVIENKSAWNVLVWFATLVALASGLKQVGFVDWISNSVAGMLSGFSPLVVMAALVVFFYLIHYLFASLTAHTTALMPVLLAIGAAIPEMPILPFSLLLGYSLGLMGVITPYATGPAPVYYGSGYIEPKDFWKLGFIFGLLYLVVLLVIGLPYLNWIY